MKGSGEVKLNHEKEEIDVWLASRECGMPTKFFFQMKETRSCLKALEKDLVESLGLNSYMWENGKRAGFLVQVEGLTFDRRKKEGMGADTILFKIWWREI